MRLENLVKQSRVEGKNLDFYETHLWIEANPPIGERSVCGERLCVGRRDRRGDLDFVDFEVAALAESYWGLAHLIGSSLLFVELQLSAEIFGQSDWPDLCRISFNSTKSR